MFGHELFQSTTTLLSLHPVFKPPSIAHGQFFADPFQIPRDLQIGFASGVGVLIPAVRMLNP